MPNLNPQPTPRDLESERLSVQLTDRALRLADTEHTHNNFLALYQAALQEA